MSANVPVDCNLLLETAAPFDGYTLRYPPTMLGSGEPSTAIAGMDFVASGTLHVRAKVCGRPNCRCAADPEARHGPYYEWSWRQDGRLVHRIIPAALAPRVQQALDNHRRIKALLVEWERETVKELLEPESG